MVVEKKTWNELHILRHKLINTQQALINIRRVLDNQIVELNKDLSDINEITLDLENLES